MPYVLLAVLVLSTGLGVGLGLSEAPRAVNHGVTDRLELSTTQVVGGRRITGWLVIENRGAAINLTEVATITVKHRGRRPSTRLAGCSPGVGVELFDSHYHQGVGFLLPCSSQPVVLRHVTTRLPVTIITTYPSCLEPGGSQAPTATPIPSCVPPNYNMPPPLPPGRYETQVVWDETVPVPRPKTVVISLRAAGR
jgi:hypothetical protein